MHQEEEKELTTVEVQPLVNSDKGFSLYTMLQGRYLLKDKRGKISESPDEMFRRVSKAIAKVDLIYDNRADVKKTEEQFYKVMKSLEFLPNSPTLMNAGTKAGQLAACFVLPLEDSITSIFESLKIAAVIQKSGAGTGFSFSRIRSKHDLIESTGGFSSGPTSFLELFNSVTEVMKKGGKRRGANMGVLNVDHPDIDEFIALKSNEANLNNFNLSVSVTDEFMGALAKGRRYTLTDPHTRKAVRVVHARDIFDMIATKAWEKGEPGILFIDRINAANPTPSLGKMEATNPCGEAPLLPYESCILGSINLARMEEKGIINWKKLKEVVMIAVHFLDNAIDAGVYPTKEIEEMTKANRKIGLGVMGFADLLIKLDIAYDSSEGVNIAGRIMQFISRTAREESIKIAAKRGSFPNFRRSVFPSRGYQRMRNAAVTTIAPTGSISLIAGCSSGIEPVFALVICRKLMGQKINIGLYPLLKEITERNSLNVERIAEELSKKGSIRKLLTIPKKMREVFVTAHDIAPEWHVKIQAAFQKYTDNAVSKTVNLPSNATVTDVKKIFLLAYELGCKGITVYRDNSREEQVLYHEISDANTGHEVQSEYMNGNCSTCTCL